jgi:hypothetical protein
MTAGGRITPEQIDRDLERRTVERLFSLLKRNASRLPANTLRNRPKDNRRRLSNNE